MDILCAPWRKHLLEKSGQGNGSERVAAGDCVFCQQLAAHEDARYFILKRCKHVFIVFNRYPYNAGHILILPNVHIPDLDQLSSAARLEMMDAAVASGRILKEVLGAQGINIGINVGKVAGGSFPSHLHMHVLPRWQGDTNFLPVLADTKTISFDLNDLYIKTFPHFQDLILS